MEYPHDRGAGQMFEPGKTDIGRQGVLIMRQASIIAIAAAVSAGAATAQYTHVHSASGGEASHSQILSSALGGSFSHSGSRDFSNGTVHADRIQDDKSFFDAIFNPGVKTDQIWNAGQYNATMIGHEAAYSHTFGFVEGSSGNTNNFQGLLRSDDMGSSASVVLDGDFRWAIKNDQKDGGHLFTSREKDNHGKDDHMVAYQLLKNGNFFGYALFFEDLKNCPDSDYNDVAVLLTLVPTPQAAMMGLTGLGGLGLLAGRRRRESM